MAALHRFLKSKPASRKCGTGYHKRKAYTVKKTGFKVPARCIRSQTVYSQKSEEFKTSLTRKASRRLKAHGKRRQSTRRCPPGMIRRASYVRSFSPKVKSMGYFRIRDGKTIKAFPKAHSTYVKSKCILNRGAPGKTVRSGQIGPLRKGELKKHGYTSSADVETRHKALESAISEFGPLGTYRKLNAVAKLTTRTVPKASTTFAADRNWIRSTYNLKAF